MLDVRPAAAVKQQPLAGAVSIPLDELGGRLFELPPKGAALRIVADGAEAQQRATQLITDAGWHVAQCVDSAAAAASDTTVCDRLWEPSPLVLEWAPHLEALCRGRVALDVGCGCGRDAAFLAARGWDFVGIDNRLKLTRQARELSIRHAEAVTAAARPNAGADGVRRRGATDGVMSTVGSAVPFLRPGVQFDLVVCVRFLERALLPGLAALVAPGGCILYSHFVDGVQLVGTPKHPSAYLEHGELRRVLGATMEVLLDVEATLSDGRPVVNFVCRRPLGAAASLA